MARDGLWFKPYFVRYLHCAFTHCS